jgi:hypothetical protein
MLLEIGRSLLYCGFAAYVIVWVLEDLLHAKSLQAFLSEELVTLIITLAALCTATMSLLLTQLTSLRSFQVQTKESGKTLDESLHTIQSALQDSFFEMMIQTILAIMAKSLYGSASVAYFSSHMFSWGHFALDVANLSVLLWALWLLWDLGSAQFEMFGALTTVIRNQSNSVDIVSTNNAPSDE